MSVAEQGGALAELRAAMQRRLDAYRGLVETQTPESYTAEGLAETRQAQIELDAALSAVEARLAKFRRFVRASDAWEHAAAHAGPDAYEAATEELKAARAALTDEDVA